MLDQHYAQPAFGHDPLQEFAEAVRLVAVESGRRLVGQQDLERADQAPGQFQEPPLPCG